MKKQNPVLDTQFAAGKLDSKEANFVEVFEESNRAEEAEEDEAGLLRLRNWVMSWRGLTIPPKTNWKRFKNGLRDLLEEEEIAGAEREEDEESLLEIYNAIDPNDDVST